MATSNQPARRTASGREALARAFLDRSGAALQRLSMAAPQDALARALSAPTDVGGVASLLSDLAALDHDISAADPWAKELADGAVLKQELLREAGGAFTSMETATLLGISRQAVDQRARRGTLLAVPRGSGERLYPACQFDELGVVAGMEKILDAFTVDNPWTRLSVLLDTDPELADRTVVQALRDGDLEEARSVVRRFGAQIAG